MTSEIIRNIDSLSRQVWRFGITSYSGSLNVYLDNWSHQSRESKRHSWKCSQYSRTMWDRISTRENRIPKPIPPDDVVQEAIAAFAAMIKYEG
jgi:hypothetical protein